MITLQTLDSNPSMTSENNDDVNDILQEFLEEFDCVSGTVHQAEGDRLKLVAHEGIPDSVLTNIEVIPFGKGMAGLAAKRREPVQVCNLQTDDSGVAESRARDTGMEGSITVPVIGSDDTLKGTVGIAKPTSYEFTPTERDQLLTASERVAHRL